MKSHKSIPDALQYVADHSESPEDFTVAPVWQLVGLALFEVANSPNPTVRGSMARATAAQRLIMDRMVGRRRPGSHPVQSGAATLEFADLAAGAIGSKEQADE